MKKYIWCILYGLLLTAFTAYVMLDTFVIVREYDVVPQTAYVPNDTPAESSPDTLSGTSSEEEVTEPEASAPIITENSYTDENISITITEVREYMTDIHIAEIKLSSSEYLKTAFAQGIFGKNVTERTSVTAEANGAIFAVNGDYYGIQEKGYVLKNGALYRSTADEGREDLVIYNDGSFEIIKESEVSATDLLLNGARQILSFGPALLVDGEIAVTRSEEVKHALVSNPRTAIGIIDELHYIVIVSDGRTEDCKGLRLYELAKFMQSLGVTTAYNLDGGGSSTMYFNGKIINETINQYNQKDERSVSDIVYIGY